MNTQDQNINKAVIAQNSKSITLDHGITLGENLIKDITIYKPNVSHLRGISLRHLLDLNVDELKKLLPRVTSPAIPEKAIDSMEIMDFTNLTGAVLGFLTPKEADQNTDTPTE